MAAQWFELEIQRPDKLPMRRILKADSPEAATAQAQRQYRDAVVRLPPPAAKATLARSYTSKSVMQNLRYRRSKQTMSTAEIVSDNVVTSVTADQSRQDMLEDLYEKDGRLDKSHPMYSLYTGLYRAAQQESRS
jgi:sensor c-di-GMP phosphodiesterase-like protein